MNKLSIKTRTERSTKYQEQKFNAVGIIISPSAQINVYQSWLGDKNHPLSDYRVEVDLNGTSYVFNTLDDLHRQLNK